MATHYDLLEIRPTASPEEIRRAYRRLSKRYHPDVNGGAAWAETRFKQLQEAYSLLMDQERRQAYNSSIRAKAQDAGASQDHSFADTGRTKSQNVRPSAEKPFEKSNPYHFYFFLFGFLLILLAGKLLFSPTSNPTQPDSATGHFTKRAPDTGESIEFLEFYKEYPSLISPSEARAVFSTPLPKGFTDNLKCYLMEGKMAEFRNHLRQLP